MARNLADKVFKNPRIPLDDAEREFGPKEISHLQDLYRGWHQKFPVGVRETTYSFPEYMVNVGRADEILYFSDKWENDGDAFDYIHDFDSHPNVYFPAGFVDGGRKVLTRTVLGSDPNKRVDLNFLAVVKELTFTSGHGDKMSLQVSDLTAPLFGTTDSKALLILTKIGKSRLPVIIRGGKMQVTPRGIVH